MQNNLNKRGKLFILSGPSGAGKGTLRERALKNVEDLVYSISCTTRQPRAGETNGVEYRFISLQDFEERIKLNKFLEYANVHGCYYGTLRADVERELDAGRDVLLEIDVQGAEQVKNILHDAILIFIMPPSREILEARLRARGTESEDVLQVRLKNAELEMSRAGNYNHVIINNDLELAAKELKEIILSYRN